MTSPITEYASAYDLVSAVMKQTRKRADIADAVISALRDAYLLAPNGEKFTVHFEDTRTRTNVVDTAEDVEIEYLNDTVLAHHFPAHAVAPVSHQRHHTPSPVSRSGRSRTAGASGTPGPPTLPIGAAHLLESEVLP